MRLEDLTNSQIAMLIDEYIRGKNAQRDREILKQRLINGICYEPLAEMFNLSVSQIKNILYKRENELFQKTAK